MKTTIIILVSLFFLPFTSYAILIDNADGTITQIRNDGSRLMWLIDANYSYTSGYSLTGKFDWYSATTWAEQLEFAGYDNWRLPKILPIDGVSYDTQNWSYDGSTDWGYNIISPNSELAYMFYVELKNLALYATDGTNPQDGWGLNNVAPFINLQSERYWSGSAVDQFRSMVFYFNNGTQSEHTLGRQSYAWAVRDMEPVPEPTTIFFFGTGIAGMIAIRIRRNKK